MRFSVLALLIATTFFTLITQVNGCKSAPSQRFNIKITVGLHRWAGQIFPDICTVNACPLISFSPPQAQRFRSIAATKYRYKVPRFIAQFRATSPRITKKKKLQPQENGGVQQEPVMCKFRFSIKCQKSIYLLSYD